ncbi:NUDIX domain-containing protein [Streptomyces sp. C10]|uniref:NUDIX domain-containing protein n=1 Tax=Streptomyces sp. C10 TaxID=531941 RepID=UPI00397F24A8
MRTPRQAARVAVLDPDGALFLFRYDNEEVGAHWAMPGGGLDPGEAPRAGARTCGTSRRRRRGRTEHPRPAPRARDHCGTRPSSRASRSRSSTLRTLPLTVIGKASSTSR